MNKPLLIGALVVGVGVAIYYFVYKRGDKLGDLNDDGKLTRNDIDILGKYIGGEPISQISPLSEAEFLRRADVNKDGAINVLDITAIVNTEGYIDIEI